MEPAILEPPPSPPKPDAAPPTPPPDPPETPPAAPVEDKIETGADDPYVQSILADLGLAVEKPPKTEDPPATPVVDAKKPDEPAPVVPPVAPPEEKKVAVQKRKPISDVVNAAVEKAVAAAVKPAEAPVTPAAPTPTPPPVDPDAEFDKTLSASERRTMEIAKVAEEKLGKRGLPGEYRNFFRKIQSYVEKERKSDPARTFDRSDAEFVAFIDDNKPKISEDDWESAREERAIDLGVAKAGERLSEKHQKELDEVKQRQKIMEFKPVLQQNLQSVEQEFADVIGSDKESELAKIASTITAKGLAAAEADDPEFIPIIRESLTNGLIKASEYTSIQQGIKSFDPKDDTHVWIAQFITKQGEHLAKQGPELTVRKLDDGTTQKFMPRGEYIRMLREKPNEVGDYWTFSDREVLSMLAINAKMDAEMKVKARQERLTKSGFERKPKTTATATSETPKETPKPTTSPKAGVTAAPGPAKTTDAPGEKLPDSFFQSLGVPKVA